MEAQLAAVLTWLEPRALLLALALPPVIRIVGHWVPEELFMLAMGVLAARADSPAAAITLLGAVLLSQSVTDHAAYGVGRWLRPRISRFPRIRSRLDKVTDWLTASPRALLGLVPARVLPLGRGAWLIGSGVAGVPWRRFAAVDLLAVVAHVVCWCGLGWWLHADLDRLVRSAQIGAGTAVAVVLGVALTASAVVLWRRRPEWQPATARVLRRAGEALRLPWR